MIGLSLPEPGNPFGWSVASQEITAALNAITKTVDVSNDPALACLHPTLHAVQGPNMMPIRPNIVSGLRDVGWAFIEEPLLAARSTLNAARNFSALVTGSTWCTLELDAAFQEAGLHIPITTAIQGVAPRFFEVGPDIQPAGDERFIVFSGGKAEFRKSQDVVIKAMIVFMNRHHDVWLNYAWHNPWGASIPGYSETLLAARGLDATRVIGPRFAPVPHDKMAGIYQRADVGLFPNRCEAGNNMVMCEFMACGKPVIATWETGHRDVLPASSLNLEFSTTLDVKGPNGQLNAVWYEPDLDEVLNLLELAYDHRAQLPEWGAISRDKMRRLTWERCAQELLKTLEDK